MSVLAGKAAIVTGGGRGIGKAIARAFAAEGARLILAARTAGELEAAREELAGEFGAEVLTRVTDVSNAGEVEALVSFALERFGRLDVLVNNAGTYGPIGELTEADPDEWRRAIEVNLLGTVYGTRAALRLMRGQSSGKIINLAGAGIGGPSLTPRISAYATSKAAVVQFTESVSLEAAPFGVQINAISPGAVTTEITNAVIKAGPERAGHDFYQRSLRQRDQGGDPPELASRLAVFLASDACRLTGKLLSAKWDAPQGVDAEAANRSSLYALRRIDGVLFQEVPKK